MSKRRNSNTHGSGMKDIKEENKQDGGSELC